MTAMTLVGIDCATQPKNIGLARGRWADGRVSVDEARVARSHDDVVDTVVAWLAEAPAVLALDAPLGWPAEMERLADHRAGAPIPVEANALFRRETDRFVQRRLGKTPLDVGADRIARTALAALAVLDAVRDHVPVAMGWTPGAVAGRHAIEVYPAATLKSRGIDARGYKRPEATAKRAEILDALDVALAPDARAAALATDHALDAVLCCLAAADYATGAVWAPEDDALARREGWMWVRDPEALTPRGGGPGGSGGRR